MKTNIILIGYRGAGKTTIGKLLAEKLNYNFIDTDEMIELEQNRKISEIVKFDGWQYFRNIETDIAKRVSSLKHNIISAGGGIILNPLNMNYLKSDGWIVYLAVEPETVIIRIKDDANRPSLTGTKSFLEEVDEVISIRKPLYENYADFIINTDELTPLKICEVILNEYRTIQKKST